MELERTVARDSTSAVAERACRECSRRKSKVKCDRRIPNCSSCEQYSRNCSYEKPGKTPLTRRHLTEVEEELARTKALLKQLKPQQRNSSISNPQFSLVHGDEIEEENANPLQFPSRNAGPPRSSAGSYIDSSQPPLSSLTQEQDVSSARPRGMRQSPRMHFDNGIAQTTTSPNNHPTPNTDTISRSNWSTMLSLESPPTSGNFEWDERGGKVGGQKFVDGMGSLTSDVNGSGYLGVASGAALLRITGGNNEHASGTSSPGVPNIPFAITSLSFLDGFIDAFFSHYHRSYPILHEATFRAQFMEIIPRPNGNAWQLLLYAVAALGAWSAATERTDIDTSLFEAAKARFSIDLLETGSLVLVQGLTLMSNYAQMGNKPNSSYNYYGLARRISMGIGLHKEFSFWESKPLVCEIRRRLWWCLYAFDVGSIITFSRPFDFPQSGVEVQLPANVHESDITSSTVKMPEPVDETTLYTHLRAQCMFHLATTQIYARMISVPFLTAKEMVELDDVSINPWLAALPHYFQLHAHQPPRYRLCHATLHWRYRNFKILMFRPFLVRRIMPRSGLEHDENSSSEDLQSEEISFQRCLDAAKESVELISNFWFNNQQTMMASWYGLYFLFQASLIPIICLRNNPRSPMAADWRDQIQEAIRVIESMIQLNPTAHRCLRVVRSLSQAYISADEGADGPTRESLQDQLTNLYPMMWPTLGSEFATFDEVNVLQESTIIDFMNQISAFE